MKRRYGGIVLINLMLLVFLVSCKNDYANEMFEKYQLSSDKMVSNNADIIPLGQYKTCDVACFHEKHEDGGRISILFNFYIGSYVVRKPCAQTVIMVYNRSTTEMDYIENAYKSGWISDDDLLHIIYEFDQASESLSKHDWQKSEEFVWDLDRYRK